MQKSLRRGLSEGVCFDHMQEGAADNQTSDSKASKRSDQGLME
jgi:hypothetical protein